MEEQQKINNEIIETICTEGEPVYCHKCGTQHSTNDKYCKNCGASLKNYENEEDEVRCPNCGSKNIDFVTYQASSNFDKGDACCGYLLCGPIGLLCGAKDKTEARTVRKCKKCGKEF